MRSRQTSMGVLSAIPLALLVGVSPRPALAQWPEVAKLTASDGETGDHFGWSASISGDVAIVGARYDDDAGLDTGSAYVFRYNGAAWEQEQKLTASDAKWGGPFGNSVSISGDVAVVGSYAHQGEWFVSGAAYAFRYDGETWEEEQELTPSDPLDFMYFGFSVSISGNVAVVVTVARWAGSLDPPPARGARAARR